MMALRLLRPFIGNLYWKIEGILFHWLLAMVSMWSWTAGYEIIESGDELAACLGQRTLVIANHQSTADVPMLMHAWNARPDVLPNLMWIMDYVFQYTNFGIVSVLHRDFFIKAGRDKREESLELLRRHLHKEYVPLNRRLLVLFPEGGFLHKRRDVSKKFAEKNNLPVPEYVTIPRAGAMKVIMEELGPQRSEEVASTSRIDASQPRTSEDLPDVIEWILDVTIAYKDRVPLRLQDVVGGIRPPCSTQLYYRLYPSSEVPSDTEGMTKWLYDRFYEKDQLLEEYYKTGNFPSRGHTNVPRVVRQDNLRYFLVHMFYLGSTILQWKAIFWLYSLYF